MPELTGNMQPKLDVLEHVDGNWGFQPGKAVYPVEGVPTGGYKSNPTVSMSYTSTASYGQELTQVNILVLSGETICQFQQDLTYNSEGDISNVSAWRLV